MIHPQAIDDDQAKLLMSVLGVACQMAHKEGDIELHQNLLRLAAALFPDCGFLVVKPDGTSFILGGEQ
jgi:hypothetical protein